MQISKRLCEFLVETKFKDIPEETVEFTKQLGLKTVAGMLNGSIRLAGRRIAGFVKDQGSPSEASLIGSGFKSSVENAVFANGIFGHACELEDDQFPSATSDILIFPILFPLAEKLGSSGRELIEAAVLSLEVMNRVGMYTLAHTGIADLSFYGIMGSTAAAGKMLGLDASQLYSAFGIAFGRASGFLVNFGTDAHYLESAMAGRDGLLAAIFAKNGMTGNGDLERGLAGLFGTQKPQFEKIIANLGKPRWHVHNMWIKKYPCCFLTHRHNDATFAILKENKITYDKVERIDLDIGPVDRVTDRPDPKDEEDARFSIQHIQAGILLEGDLNFDTFTVEKIHSPLFKEIRSRVKVHVHEDWPAEMMSGTARVTLTTKDGRSFSKEMQQPLGGSDSPLTPQEFKEIYRKLTIRILSEKQIEWTCKTLLNLEKIDDLQELMQNLTYPQAAERKR
jgi:2-methylcitrate dehydratase PrpD